VVAVLTAMVLVVLEDLELAHRYHWVLPSL
jgi:hypothetical protein